MLKCVEVTELSFISEVTFSDWILLWALLGIFDFVINQMLPNFMCF
jgi:hypothetical protein